MPEGFDAWTKTGTGLANTYYYSLIANSCLHAGQTGDGLATIKDGLVFVEKSSDHCFEADLYRLKGELLLQRDGPDAAGEAEACFHKALDIAENQGRYPSSCAPPSAWPGIKV